MKHLRQIFAKGVVPTQPGDKDSKSSDKTSLRSSTPKTFSSLRRKKERRQEKARVYDIDTARNDLLINACQQPGSQHADDMGSRPDTSLSRPDTSLSSYRPDTALSLYSFGQASFCDTGRQSAMSMFSAASSRPSTRRDVCNDVQNALERTREEVGDKAFVSIAGQQFQNNEYWLDLNSKDSAKQTPPPCYLTEPGDVQKAFGNLFAKQDKTVRYAKQCRADKTHAYVPLGPRRKVNAHLPVERAQFVREGVLDYQGWSIGSDRLQVLCESYGENLDATKYCNLSNNRIDDKALRSVCQRVLCKVETLDLSDNMISRKGAEAIANELKNFGAHAPTPLLELSLACNRIGGGVKEHGVRALSVALQKGCPQLRGLSLAQNQIGKFDEGAGQALGDMVASMHNLQTLDLHWNYFTGRGAQALLRGILENGMNSGRLARLDLSWNRLGAVDSAETAQVLADVFQEHVELFHVDISYNSFSFADCGTLAEGLKNNHTLFGLHLLGNSACVDSAGFIVPMLSKGTSEYETVVNVERTGLDPEVAKPGCKLTGRQQQSWARELVLNVQKYSKADVENHDHSEDRNCGDDPAKFGAARRRPFDSFQRQVTNCWICENWQQVPITFTTGASDINTRSRAFTPGVYTYNIPIEDIKLVLAFLNIDNFTRPVQLTKTTRVVKKKKTVVVWEGFCALPPTDFPMLVIFQVNGSVMHARDLPVHKLPVPITLSLQGTPEFSLTPAEASDCSAEGLTAEVHFVNELACSGQLTNACKAKSLWNECSAGSVPMAVVDDPKKARELHLHPRMTIAQPKKKVPHNWGYNISVWAQWKPGLDAESPEVLRKCFEKDYRLTKITKFVKSSSDLMKLHAMLEKSYPLLLRAYRYLSVLDVNGAEAFGVGLNGLTDFFTKCHIYDDRTVDLKDTDTIFIVAKILDHQVLSEVQIRNDKALIRHQFLEALIRLAEQFVKRGRVADYEEAAQEMLKRVTPYAKEQEEQEKMFRSALFCEEVDIVYKQNLKLLSGIFDQYVSIRPGKPKAMNAERFQEFLFAAGAHDHRFTDRLACVAFVMGSMLQINEISNDRHLHLNFSEFLVAIGAVVFLRQHWTKEEYADLMLEFLEENVAPLLKSKKDSGEDSSGCSINALMDVLTNIFYDADTDKSGSLSRLEFLRIFRQTKIQEDLKAKGFVVPDLEKLFDALDETTDHKISLDEILEGCVRVYKQNFGVDRITAFLLKVFDENDADGSGALGASEFQKAFQSAPIKRKLMRLGLEPQELQDLFDAIDVDHNGSVTADEMVEGFISLRDPHSIDRYIVFLKQAFEQADVDKSGDLTKMEFKMHFTSPEVQKKMKRYSLDVKEWSELFDYLDVDRDMCITRKELIDGFRALKRGEHQVQKQRS